MCVLLLLLLFTKELKYLFSMYHYFYSLCIFIVIPGFLSQTTFKR